MGLGLIYGYLIHIEISTPQQEKTDKTRFSFNIHSKIAQTINLHIATRDELNGLHCEDTPNRFKYYSKGYDYKQQEEVKITIKKGLNHCYLKTLRASNLKPIIKQKITFVDYVFLFIFFIIPLFNLLFYLFITLLNKLWRENDA